MRLRVLPFVFVACLFPSNAILSGQTPLASEGFGIAGTVVDRSNNSPLGGAVVTAAPVGQPGETSLSCRTGADGRFLFTRLRPGKYSLVASRRGFRQQHFEENQNYSTAIAVGPGLSPLNIVFPLSQGGSITGSVLDEENDPVGTAQVLLFRKRVVSGSIETSEINARMTDASGHFHFPHVEAGVYFVAVQARPWYAQNVTHHAGRPESQPAAGGGELDVVYPLTYYSGTVDPASATAITVAEGGSSNLQIVLHAVPALHIRITGLESRAGRGVGVNVTQRGLGGSQVFSNSQSVFAGDHLEISGLAPGRYLVSPVTFGHGRPEPLASGTFDFSMDEQLDLSAFPRTSLTGRLTFEGNAPPHPALWLFREGSPFSFPLSVGEDGALQASERSIAPGRYRLNLRNSPGFYLKSIAAKGATVSAGEIEIPEAGSVQLTLVAAAGVTQLNGTAMKDGRSFAGAMVLLIPKDFRRDWIRRDQSDSDGTFTLSDVPPGRYTLLALEEGQDLPYQDPAALRPYLSRGKDLDVPTGGSPLQVDVLLPPAPRG